MTAARWLALVAMVGIGLLTSYGFALIGEPQSEWLWCSIGGLCE